MRLEAYYGDPLGGCSCPPQQSLLSSGVCPGRPSYRDPETKNDVPEGICTNEYDPENDDDYVGFPLLHIRTYIMQTRIHIYI